MITLKPIKEILQRAYMLSQPVGMGHLQFTPGPLSDAELTEYVGMNSRSVNGAVHYSFDYVKGRAVKLSVVEIIGTDTYDVRIDGGWFDHSDHEVELLRDALKMI